MMFNGPMSHLCTSNVTGWNRKENDCLHRFPIRLLLTIETESPTLNSSHWLNQWDCVVMAGTSRHKEWRFGVESSQTSPGNDSKLFQNSLKGNTHLKTGTRLDKSGWKLMSEQPKRLAVVSYVILKLAIESKLY